MRVFAPLPQGYEQVLHGRVPSCLRQCPQDSVSGRVVAYLDLNFVAVARVATGTHQEYPGCRKPVPLGAKYCEAHKAAGEARDTKFAADRDRPRTERAGASSARGYGYKWQRLRARILVAHPLCVECEKRGLIKLATDVDHTRPHKGNPFLLWDKENLQPLCHECHSRKTARKDGGFGNGG